VLILERVLSAMYQLKASS